MPVAMRGSARVDEYGRGRRRVAESEAELQRLTGRAAHLADVLGKSKSVSEEMITILSSFDKRLNSLETAMRPIQVKTLAFRKAHANIDSTITAVESVLTHFDVPTQVEQRIKDGPRRDLDAYLAAVDRLKDAIAYFNEHPTYKAAEGASLLSHNLMREAMTMLEADFRQLLANNSKAMDPAKILDAMPELKNELQVSLIPDSPLTGPLVPLAGAPPPPNITLEPKPMPALLLTTLVERLAAVARRMIENGAGSACTSVYREVRGNTLLNSLKRLGVEMLTRDDVLRMPWEEMEQKISAWMHYMKIGMTLIFPMERELCYQVFAGLDPHREICFAELADRGLSLLLSFGESVAAIPKSPEKLFVLLDMYETIRETVPLANDAFPGNACIPCREYVRQLQRSLAQCALDTFREFEDAVEKDSTRTPVVDGTVHPLTSYVINYVKFLFDYEGTLKHLFDEIEKDKMRHRQAAAGTGEQVDGKARLEAATLRILSVLEENLETKGKVYKDLAQTQFFLMNNKHYIMRSIRKMELARLLVGDEWLNRHKKIVQQHEAMYLRLGWSKLLALLLPSNEAINKNSLKEKLKVVNAEIEEQVQKQTQWTVPDPDLQREVRQAVEQHVVPVFRDFFARYRSIMDSLKHANKYIKYTPEDLSRKIGHLFEGRPALS